MRAAALLLIAGLAVPGAAISDTPTRCATLGQMAVSSWLQMARLLAQPDAKTLDPVVARLADLTNIYATLDCDIEMLGASMDCLLERSGSVGAEALALACMVDTGLATGG